MSAKLRVLINCDLGESEAQLLDGTQQSILAKIHLANVCCGAHAGGEALTRLTMQQAAEAKVRVGAHPGYPDPEHFGRRPLFGTQYDAAQVSSMVAEQVAFAIEAAASSGLSLYHVKAHGALYNEAAVDGAVAEAIAVGVRRVAKDVFLVGLAKSVMLNVFRRQGFAVLRESFADRRYTKEGLLVPRTEANAMIDDPVEALSQLQAIAGFSDTVCIHSDTPNALAMLDALMPFCSNLRPVPPART